MTIVDPIEQRAACEIHILCPSQEKVFAEGVQDRIKSN